MSRNLRWGLGLLLIAALLLGAFLFLPFRDWLPGGTVANIPTRQVVNGTAFNHLFPTPGTGEKLVFTQEKRGFSEARLKRGDQVVALLAISDTTTAPTSRAKFASSKVRLQGWPMVDQGTQSSGLLVADRFQVKVIGQGTGLDRERRHSLLEQFDLRGLASLNPAFTLPETQAETSPTATGSAPRVLPPGRRNPLRFPLPGLRKERSDTAGAPVPVSPLRSPKSAVLEPAA